MAHTIQFYRDHTTVTKISQGAYKIIIDYRSKEYTCYSNNSEAYDRIDDDNYPDNYVIGRYSNKQAWAALYNECKQKNNL